METIRNYLDNLFRAYPNTPEVRRAKEELLGIMEDKYHELKAEGKSENEAIGIVISEFGSMDEISFDLGLKEEKTSAGSFQEPFAEAKHFSAEQAKNFLQKQESFGRKIATGVALCILSPTAAIVMSSLESGRFLPSRITDMIGAAGLFVMVAIAVGIFIVSGISHEKLDKISRQQIFLDLSAKAEIERQYDAYHAVFGMKIAVGVILCILSVVPVIFMDTLFDHTFLSWMNDLSALGLFVFVAAGVFLFITAGIKKDAYEILLGRGDHRPKNIRTAKKDKLIQMISAIYWPLVTVVYLTFSFATNSWGTSWIIWVISGILFGGISAVISLAYEN